MENSEQLQALLPTWKLDKNTVNWLWFWLRIRSNTDDILAKRGYGSPAMCNLIADHINSKEGLLGRLYTLRDTLLPGHFFDWINARGRLPAWLLHQLNEERNARLPHNQIMRTRFTSDEINFSLYLTPKEEFIVRINLSDEPAQAKESHLQQLQQNWNKHKLNDKYFSWFTRGGNEKKKCQCAWEWYQTAHPHLNTYTQEFSKKEDVLRFLDIAPFTLEAKLQHLDMIKRKFKAQQTRANRQGKAQTNLSLSDDARKQLDSLARKQGKSKTEIVEKLIQAAYTHDLLS